LEDIVYKMDTGVNGNDASGREFFPAFPPAGKAVAARRASVVKAGLIE
jgi:hypothetical protein